MLVFKPNLIEGFLFALYSDGVTKEEAFLKVCEHTRETSISQEQVSHIFAVFDRKDFNLKEHWTGMSTSVLLYLAQTANPAFEEIVKSMNLNARLSLCRTSRVLHFFSDRILLHINHLTVRFTKHYINIYTDDGYTKTFIRTDNYRRATETHIEFKFRQEEFCRSAASAIVTIFNFTRLTIGTISVIQDFKILYESWPDCLNNIFTIFERALSRRRNKISIERFASNVELGIGSFLQSIIPFVNPKTFKSVAHFSSDGLPSFAHTDSFWNFYNTEQWRSVETFVSDHPIHRGNLVDHYSHFNSCKIRVEKAPTVHDFNKMIMILLANENLKEYKIRTKLKKTDFDAINELVGTHNIYGRRSRYWSHFRYPSFKIKLSVCVSDNVIWFKGPCFVAEEAFLEDDEVEEDDFEDMPIIDIDSD